MDFIFKIGTTLEIKYTHIMSGSKIRFRKFCVKLPNVIPRQTLLQRTLFEQKNHLFHYLDILYHLDFRSDTTMNDEFIILKHK